MVHALLDGNLDSAGGKPDPIFGLSVPTAVPGVPSEVLDPRGTWSDAGAYDIQAKKLAGMFRKNFEKFGGVADSIRAAGPRG
jgi:phosphoenolpyruvate carboxykinase (ATP)